MGWCTFCTSEELALGSKASPTSLFLYHNHPFLFTKLLPVGAVTVTPREAETWRDTAPNPEYRARMPSAHSADEPS